VEEGKAKIVELGVELSFLVDSMWQCCPAGRGWDCVFSHDYGFLF